MRGLAGKRKNPGTDDRARRAARAGDPIAVVRERLRAGLVTPEQVAWAEALTWKPRPGRSSPRARPGDFVRRGLVPFEEGLTELVGSGAIRWHLQGGRHAYEYAAYTPGLRLHGEEAVPPDAFFLAETDGSAHGSWQIDQIDAPYDEASVRFQQEAAVRYAASIERRDPIPTSEVEEFSAHTAWWYVTTHMLPRKEPAALAAIAFLAIHNTEHAWEVLRAWQPRYWTQAHGGQGTPHPAILYRELDEDLAGLVVHLLGGPPPEAMRAR
jgi:hypothetical protein